MTYHPSQEPQRTPEYVNPPHAPQWVTAEPKKKKNTVAVVSIIVTGVVVLGCCLGIVFSPKKEALPIVTPTESYVTEEPTQKPEQEPKKQAAPTSYGAGTYEVGTEIKPGTYTTTSDGDFCYWSRLKDFDGDLGSIIANDLIVEGKGRMTVKKTDAGVEFSGDCVWTKK